jgi:hypothetical protein
VDVNRNFQNWFNPLNAAPGEEDYQGPAAMSEWETNIVRTLSDRFHPHAFIDIHSGDLGLGYVYGHSSRERSQHDAINRQWIANVNKEVFHGQVWTGNLANMGTMPYESHGSSCDYMYESQHAKISGTWEVWKKESFFAASADAASASTVASTASTASTDASGKYQHVYAIVPLTAPDQPIQKSSQALVPEVKPVEIQALQLDVTSTKAPAIDAELLAMVQTQTGDNGFDEALGLHKEDLITLVQAMKAEGKENSEVQTLLQEMSREQCFAYFNPIMPEHYDSTVSNFAYAVLVGAEGLTSPDVAAALHN